jgi:type VI secretion system protein ImpH
MAATFGTDSDTLTLLRRFEESPHEQDFFAVLRQLECIHADRPRLGEAARPVDEPVRLGQEPSLAFAPATIASFRSGNKQEPHRLSAYFFGLFGPHGPLPLHLTEYAKDRERNADDPTLRRFADMFHHRLLTFFYRAWADADPCRSLDRRDSSRFDAYVGSVFGVGTPELHDRDEVPDDAKRYLAGILALGNRPVAGLKAILCEFFRLPFAVREFVGEWLKLPEADWCSLGVSGTRLGEDSIAGCSVWNCQHKFRLVCGALTFAEFVAMLPGGGSLRRLHDLVRNYLGDELDWDLNLVLKTTEVPRMCLGSSGALGWTTWLGDRQTATDADDVIIRPSIARS